MPVTEAQINELKNAHWDLFSELIKGAKFRVELARQYGLNSPGFLDFNSKYIPLVQNWLARELEMEYVFERNTGKKGMVLSGDLGADDFFISASLPKLDQLKENAGNYYPNVV